MGHVRVVQVNSVYGVGSTGVLTSTLHHGLMRHGHDSLVLYGRGPEAQVKNVIRLCSNTYAKANKVLGMLNGYVYGGCHASTGKAIELLQAFKPDVVHLQCVNEHFVNVYQLLSWLAKTGTPTVITLHADFMFTANCGSAMGCEGWRSGCRSCPDFRRATGSLLLDRTSRSFDRMRQSFGKFGDELSIVAVSPWLAARAGSSPMLAGRPVTTILNGVNCDTFRPMEGAGEGERPYLLFVTSRFTDAPGSLKGGRHVIDLARRLADLPLDLVVAGPSEVDQGRLPANVRVLGRIADPCVLARLYSGARATILASRQETFSMPCAESLCCGTPVVGFEAGGPESVALPEASTFVPYGDMDALEAAVRARLDMGLPSRLEVAAHAARVYSNVRMVDEYERAYRSVACL